MSNSYNFATNLYRMRMFFLSAAVLLISSCKKVDWPWSNPPSPASYKLDTNTVVGATMGIIDGFQSDSSAFPTDLKTLLVKDGYQQTSVFNRSPFGGGSYLLLKSLIHDQLTPLKSATGKNIVVTGGMAELLLNNRTPDSDLLNTLKLYCTALKDSGWKVYILTNPYQNPAFNNQGIGHGGNATNSGYDSAEFIERVLALNDSVRASFSSYADGLIEIDANPRFAAFDSSYYQLNHFYFTENGLNAISKIVYDALTPELSH